jgi:RNA polymerase sigma factor (sigma-70 family)
MKTLDEEKLISLLKKGDTRAFDLIFKEYRVRIYSYLVRLSKSLEVAENLSQEVWLRLATNTPDLTGKNSLARWLFTVARNLFYSHQRKNITRSVILKINLLLLIEEAPKSPFEEAACSEQEAKLEKALAELPLKYREIILLVIIEGMDTREAAALCGISYAAARTRLSRAKALLQKKFCKNDIIGENAYGHITQNS